MNIEKLNFSIERQETNMIGLTILLDFTPVVNCECYEKHAQ